tara:strand:- start:194 stop:373 length:180 start_codon:yes stop_codon:yes gene_type:complete
MKIGDLVQMNLQNDHIAVVTNIFRDRWYGSFGTYRVQVRWLTKKYDTEYIPDTLLRVVK